MEMLRMQGQDDRMTHVSSPDKQKIVNRTHSIDDFQMYPHAESNRNRQNRNLKFYPLNYRGSIPSGSANILKFVDFTTK